ncbi:MAG: hypothetical protein AN485_03115 [Anabaena sp. MDT14b]|jgi:hypothetical protein|nr:MAG: hypothetical protein AN485_03115 [Anabaena sp. MDT14b]
MKLRNLGLALTAVCATVAGVVGAANNAYAATTTATINYSGVVLASCSFGNIQNGIFLSSSNALSAGFQGFGTPGSASVFCHGAGTITVADPVKTSGPALTAGAKIGAWITDSADPNDVPLAASPGAKTDFVDATAPTSNSVNNEDRTYKVRMAVKNGNDNLLIPGNYSYSTTLTATY